MKKITALLIAAILLLIVVLTGCENSISEPTVISSQETTEEIIEPTTEDVSVEANVDWKELYLDYITDDENIEIDYFEFAFVKITNDDIPELVCLPVSVPGPAKLLWLGDENQVLYTEIGKSDFKYHEKSLDFYTQNSNYGFTNDMVFLFGGKPVVTFEGNIYPEGSQDENGNSLGGYYINGTSDSVSETEYYDKLYDAFDMSTASIIEKRYQGYDILDEIRNY